MLSLAGIGFEADTVRAADRQLKDRFGRMVYIMAGLERLQHLSSFNAVLETERATIEIDPPAAPIAVTYSLSNVEESIERKGDRSETERVSTDGDRPCRAGRTISRVCSGEAIAIRKNSGPRAASGKRISGGKKTAIARLTIPVPRARDRRIRSRVNR